MGKHKDEGEREETRLERQIAASQIAGSAQTSEGPRCPSCGCSPGMARAMCWITLAKCSAGCHALTKEQWAADPDIQAIKALIRQAKLDDAKKLTGGPSTHSVPLMPEVTVSARKCPKCKCMPGQRRSQCKLHGECPADCHEKDPRGESNWLGEAYAPQAQA